MKSLAKVDQRRDTAGAQRGNVGEESPPEFLVTFVAVGFSSCESRFQLLGEFQFARSCRGHSVFHLSNFPSGPCFPLGQTAFASEKPGFMSLSKTGGVLKNSNQFAIATQTFVPMFNKRCIGYGIRTENQKIIEALLLRSRPPKVPHQHKGDSRAA